MEQDADKGLVRSYVSLDNASILQVAKSDPTLFLRRYQPLVLIDEMQKAPKPLPYMHGTDTCPVSERVWAFPIWAV